MRPAMRPCHRPLACVNVALGVVLGLVVVPLATAISKAASEIETTFVVLPSLGECAQSIQHERIASYKGINSNDADGTYDAIVWSDLKVNGKRCASVHDDLQSTFFRPMQTPTQPGTDSPLGWFLIGVDNSPRRCEAYSTNLQARYFFTRDLDTFRDRFERRGYLLPGVATNAKRGMVFMFVLPFGSQSFLEGAPCAYVDERHADGLISNVDSGGGDDAGDAEASSEAVAAGGGDDEPACFGGEVQVEMADGGLRLMKHLRVGDFVAGVYSPQRVVAFSHADEAQQATFISLQVAVRRANSSVEKVLSLQVTRDHVLYDKSGRAMSAEEARVGTALRAVRGELVVVEVRSERGVGVWAPVTTEGALIVRGGMVVSCYSRLFEVNVAHALLAPVRAFWTGAVDWGLVATDFGRVIVLWMRASSR
ncbi:Desert hedgehog protein B [Gracilariopsis chorda]|uniref:Desert hedgehog protein B n=1 Tax=Gracilariopsis chorda TaxID=448386 RepID=A0A2V3IU11_9FLOR|nr:Desert hedgehog protein B [Gracilariopsis chorda]|eukprot:PXF45592.1 Desert hedgehog protein B [Gracilariopsis chorda]